MIFKINHLQKLTIFKNNHLIKFFIEKTPSKNLNKTLKKTKEFERIQKTKKRNDKIDIIQSTTCQSEIFEEIIL